MAKVLFICRYDFIEKPTIQLLSAVLKSKGHECHYLDLKFEKHLLQEVEKISPDIIAFSISTGMHTLMLEVCRSLKQSLSFISIFGGAHCTFFPEFIEEDGVDIICRGEGEYALAELADAVDIKSDFSSIRNLYVKKDGGIIKNELRPLIENLDSLPFPDRSIFDKYAHYRKMRRRYLITSRGCPYNCSYCFNNSLKKIVEGKGKYVRQKSVSNVIEELKLLRENYKPLRIKFYDDIFVLNKNWILDFCEQYKKEINIPFIAQIRVNLVNEEIIKALKQAGCITVDFGIESGNPEFRKIILKRDIPDNQILEVALLLKKYGIKTLTFNMVGLPDETIDMCFDTIRLNIKAKISYTHVLIFTPYPGSDLSDYAVSKGYFNGDKKSINSSFIYSGSLMNMKDIRKIKRLQYLFSITVAVPLLMPLTRFLISLPFDKVYQAVYFLHRVWCAAFVTKHADWKDFFIFEKR